MCTPTSGKNEVSYNHYIDHGSVWTVNKDNVPKNMQVNKKTEISPINTQNNNQNSQTNKKSYLSLLFLFLSLSTLFLKTNLFFLLFHK